MCHSPFAAKGGFGEVWRAEWDGLEYAVKIFRSTLYSHWGREGEIYKTCMLTHPNILQFISMDSDDNSSKCMCKVKVTLYFRFTSTSLPFLSTPPLTHPSPPPHPYMHPSPLTPFPSLIHAPHTPHLSCTPLHLHFTLYTPSSHTYPFPSASLSSPSPIQLHPSTTPPHPQTTV